MSRIFKVTAFALAACAAACSDTTSLDDSADLSLSSAFLSTPGGFSNMHSSFVGGDSMGFAPHTGRMGGGMMGGGMMGGGMMGGRQHGRGSQGPGFGSFMGGGLHHNFFGDIRAAGCVFNAASGRLECPAETHNGITVSRSLAFATAAGTAQQAFDSVTTDRINVRVSVTGTHTRRDSAVTTVSHANDRTITGLSPASTQRTVNGTVAGTETTNGRDASGTFTAVRTFGDTITNVVVPKPTATSTQPYPLSGRIVRTAKVTLNRAGTTNSSTRREVVIYDGSATAKVEITQDGTTKICTLPLLSGRLTCN